MLYFIVHNNTLSLFKENPEKDLLNLHSKIAFHHPLLSCINDSKILNNVNSQALDELNEKELLENQDASIIISDSLLSHSLVINEGQTDSELAQKIKGELQAKWKDLFDNYFYISENKKSSKKTIHIVEVNHYLKDKIKLNFNNFGIDIKSLVPMSSIALSNIKTTQYGVMKSKSDYLIFSYSRKGFSFFKANYTSKGKMFDRIVGFSNLSKVSEATLKKSNTKFRFFSDIDIIKNLSHMIKNSVPMLNFINPVGVQIVEGSLYEKKKTFTKQTDTKNFFYHFRNAIAALLTLIVLLISLRFVNQTDLKALNVGEGAFKDSKQVEDIINPEPILNKINPVPVSANSSDYNQFEAYYVKSYAMIDAFQSVLDSDYSESIDMLNVVNGTLSAQGNVDITGLLVDVDPNSVKEINLSENKISYKVDLFSPPEDSQNSISISNFLNSVVDIKNIDFKLIDGTLLNEKVDNLILRIEQKDVFENVINHIKDYDNFIVRKISFKRSDNSTHIYITVLS